MPAFEFAPRCSFAHPQLPRPLGGRSIHQDAHGAWVPGQYLAGNSKLEQGFKTDLTAMPNKWSTSAVPKPEDEDKFMAADGSYVTYVEQSFLADMEPKCAVNAGTKFSYIKPCVSNVPGSKCGTDEEGTPQLENRLSAAKWFMMNQDVDDQIYVTHSGAPASCPPA